MKKVLPGISELFPFALALVLSAAGLGMGCKAKPSEKSCREAIDNIRRISGQDANKIGTDPIAAIRSCRGNSSKAAVECWRQAKTEADLEKCEKQVGVGGTGDKNADDKTADDKSAKPE